MSGATGNHEYAADAAIIRNQKKGAAVQEWKQWALDHKDFESFRAEAIGVWEKLSERLESDEFAEEWLAKEEIIKKENAEQEEKERKEFYRITIPVLVIAIVLGAFLWESGSGDKEKSSPNTSRLRQATELIAS